MSFIECIQSAFSSVMSHKMRSSLTMLGIIIGIGSVIMIMGLGAGFTNAIFEVANSISRSVIQVYADGGAWEDLLTYEDAEALTEIDNVDKISCMSQLWNAKINLRVPGETETGPIIGVDENLSVIESYDIALGRFITKNDVENVSMVTVIKPETAINVFGRIDCIGEKITIDTSYYGVYEFTVVGVLRGSDDGMLGQMLNTPMRRSIAVIPITTLNELAYWDNIVDVFGVGVHDVTKATETCKEITDLLDVRHNKRDGYHAESMESQFDQIGMVLGAVTGFVAFVAAISLFVGGVGVMNIMLVTVKERTREIGVRKSLGATRGAIRLQFVMEAVILSAIGGVIGLLLGVFGAQGIGVVVSGLAQTSIVPVVQMPVVALAMGVSALVGIIFGVYPAGKAAKLDPIEALRYE